jgi:hypothetical protein
VSTKSTDQFAPAREDGLRPYVVTSRRWVRRSTRIVYAENAGGAVQRLTGNRRGMSGIARRAMVDDMERLT